MQARLLLWVLLLRLFWLHLRVASTDEFEIGLAEQGDASPDLYRPVVDWPEPILVADQELRDGSEMRMLDAVEHVLAALHLQFEHSVCPSVRGFLPALDSERGVKEAVLQLLVTHLILFLLCALAAFLLVPADPDVGYLQHLDEHGSSDERWAFRTGAEH